MAQNTAVTVQPENIRSELISQVTSQKGCHIALVGSRNKGKTFLIKLLTDNLGPRTAMASGSVSDASLADPSPDKPRKELIVDADHPVDTSLLLTDSALVSTPGVMTMQTNVEGVSLIFADSHGRDDAVPQCVLENREDAYNVLKASKAAERFEQRLMSEFAKNVLLVMGQINRVEQEMFLNYMYNNKESKESNRKIFVAHNWRHVTKQSEFDVELERLSSILGAVDQPEYGENLVAGTVLKQVGIVYEVTKDEGPPMTNVIVSVDGHSTLVREGVDLDGNDEPVPNTGKERYISPAEWKEDLQSNRLLQISQSTSVCAVEFEYAHDMEVPFIKGERHDVQEYHYIFVEEGSSQWATKFNRASAHLLKTRLKNCLDTKKKKTTVGGRGPRLHANQINIPDELCSAIEAVVAKNFKSLTVEQAGEMELVVERKETALTDMPVFKWVPNDKATSVSDRLMDEEAMKVALTAYTYNVFPEVMGDMVLKSVSPTGDFTDLIRDGLEIAVNKKFLIKKAPDGKRVSFLVYLRNREQLVFQDNDHISLPPKIRNDANNLPKIHGVPIKYEVYHQLDPDAIKIQWRIQASGIAQMDWKQSNIYEHVKYGFESTPCIMLNTQKLVKAKDPADSWMKVTMYPEVQPRRSREQDGLIMLPVKYFIDTSSVQVENKDGQIVITVSGFTRRKF